MADTYEKDLAQKSTLTLNDFIRVVGADNVSYKQQVSNVASALGITPHAIAENGDLNSITTIGLYYTPSTAVTASITNKPADLVSAFSMEVQKRGDYVNQIICDYAGTIYVRGQISSGWYSWQKLPTRSEIESTTGGVPIRKAGNVASGESFTIDISNILSQNEGFALVALNIGGNALIGVELLFLGRGTSKVKALLGTMSTSYYTATYSNNSTWTITNTSSSIMLYTAIISK